MIISPSTSQYITRKVFQDFGKQFLVDVKYDFRIASGEIVYKLGSGTREPRKTRRTRYQALDDYFRVLNGHISNVESAKRPVLV